MGATDHPAQGLAGVLQALGGVHPGPDGVVGRSGRSGEISRVTSPLNAMFLGLSDPGFERSRLRVEPN